MNNTIYFTAIASGSNGNCYYIGNSHEALLVDAGVSAKQIIDRMARLNLDISRVKGIVVTHEHGDHVRGIPVLTRKCGIPVYITEKTRAAASLDVAPSLVQVIAREGTLEIGELSAVTFSKYHDASDPLSVTVSWRGKSISVLTDIGFPCENVIQSVAESDVLFLETNYEEKLLEAGSYPAFLKNRISGKEGHLSNRDSARLIYKYATTRLKYLLLSHLSENNNTAVYASSIMEEALARRPELDTELLITDRYREIAVMCLKVD